MTTMASCSMRVAFVLFLVGAIGDVTGFSTIHQRSNNNRITGTSLAAAPRLNSVTNVKKRKKNVVADDDDEDGETKNIPTGLPPALMIEGLTCSHDGGTVFQLRDVSYILPRTRKIGLVGRNGCGKSTLMNILAETCCKDYETDDREPTVYTGTVEVPRDVNVAFVEQEPLSPSDVTVGDALLGIKSNSQNNGGKSNSNSNSVYQIVRNYGQVCNALEFDDDAFNKASAAMDAADGWNVLTKADEISMRLQLDDLKDQSLSNLSGGERKRVAIGAALVQSPDVLLLDEPTNHLDLKAIRLLSDVISDEKKMTVLCITHDRSFLNEVCDRIVELDDGSIYGYEGNYGDFLVGKEARYANEDKVMSSRKKKLTRELAWMRKQPSGRQSKSKARQEAFHKLSAMTKPRRADSKIVLENDDRRLGTNILKMENVSLKFGDRVMLDDFSYDFNAGDTIGIVGGNGVGKSTFIKMACGRQEPDSGTITPGETVSFGVYDQMGIPLDDNCSVMDFVKQRVLARDGSTMAEAPSEVQKLLKQFQFPKERWVERIIRLSGGERRRLQLLSVLTQRPNFLILDEPVSFLSFI
ncbi:MAG: ATP-binding cassette subfamily F protein uup [Bacillariaceae sp.]|jgi:ATP-binding cassette subfamily F protein uup